jgi:hypothetical protein
VDCACSNYCAKYSHFIFFFKSFAFPFKLISLLRYNVHEKNSNSMARRKDEMAHKDKKEESKEKR